MGLVEYDVPHLLQVLRSAPRLGMPQSRETVLRMLMERAERALADAPKCEHEGYARRRFLASQDHPKASLWESAWYLLDLCQTALSDPDTLTEQRIEQIDRFARDLPAHMGAGYSKEQGKKARNKRTPRPIREILEKLANRIPREKTIELWPRFFGDLEAEGFSPELIEEGIEPDKWKVIYSLESGKRKPMSYSTFRKRIEKLRR